MFTMNGDAARIKNLLNWMMIKHLTTWINIILVFEFKLFTKTDISNAIRQSYSTAVGADSNRPIKFPKIIPIISHIKRIKHQSQSVVLQKEFLLLDALVKSTLEKWVGYWCTSTSLWFYNGGDPVKNETIFINDSSFLLNERVLPLIKGDARVINGSRFKYKYHEFRCFCAFQMIESENSADNNIDNDRLSQQ